MIDPRASFNGFHNPYKHKGLTPTEFLQEYLHGRVNRLQKNNSAEYRQLIVDVLVNWEKAVTYVAEHFKNTLRSPCPKVSDRGQTAIF